MLPSDPRKAAIQVVYQIRIEAAARLAGVVMPVLEQMANEGDGLQHPAVMVTAVNDYCAEIDLAPFGKALIRSGALDYIENQQAHDPAVVELVAHRLVESAVRSSSLSVMRDPRGKRQAVKQYLGVLRQQRKAWNKRMGNNEERLAVLTEELPVPPPSEPIIESMRQLFSQRGLV